MNPELGALIYFVLILNIFVITVSYGFTGTPVVTGLMLLAVVYLLIWDLPAYMPLVRNQFHYEPVRLDVADKPFWGFLGAIMTISIIMLAILYQNMLLQLGIPFTEGLIGFVVFWLWKRKNGAQGL